MTVSAFLDMREMDMRPAQVRSRQFRYMIVVVTSLCVCIQILMSVGSLKARAMKMQSVLTLKEVTSVSAGQDTREMVTTAQVS